MTTLESDKLILKSKGDTTLNGAQAKAERIDTDVGGKLSIISTQDSIDQSTEQTGIGGRVQASLGTAWQVSGNYSNSEANGKSNSVNQQSGLFAGEGGYHVKADSVDLKGGAITSTATKDNNELTTNSLTYSNIENQSAYDATSVALSGGTQFGEATQTDSQGNKYSSNVNWRESTTFSPSLPQQDKDSDSSTTYATMSAGNINIGGKDTTVEKLGIHSDINTANQKVDDIPDLKAILDKQKIVSDATSTIVAATRTYSQNKQAEAEAQKQAAEAQALEKLKAEGGADWEKYNSTDDYVTKQNLLKNALPAYKDASDQAQTWGMGGNSSRALNAVTTAITAALGGQSDLQVVTNTLAPYAAQVIGQEFGHGADKNTAAQLVSHAILGATLAYINGGDPTAGGSAAVASEAAAIYLTNQYKVKKEYQDANGEFQPNLLPENVKTQIRDLTAGIGAVIGGAVGDSTYNAQLAGVIGQNAVENNYLTAKQIQQFDQEMGSCKVNNKCDQILEKYKELALNQDKELAAICSVNAVLCKEKYGFIVEYRNKIKQALVDTKNLPPNYERGLFAQQIDAEGFVFNVELARQFKNKYNISDEDAVRLAMAASAVGAGKALKIKNTANSKYPVPVATKAENGLFYKSNSKHTLGGEGNRPNAGIEPKNSLELFEKSVPISGNSNKRFTIDSKGDIHQFTYEGTGSNNYHWAGGTGDARNPLKLDNKTKAMLRKNGWKSEALK